MILDANGMPVLQPLVDDASTATFNTAFAAIGTSLDPRIDAVEAQSATAWADFSGQSNLWTASNLAPAIGNGTLVARWRRTGAKTIELRYDLIFGGTTTGGRGAWSFALPTGFTAHGSGKQAALFGEVYSASRPASYPAYVIIGASATTFNIKAPAGDATSYTSPVRNTDNSGVVGQGVPLVAGQYTYTTGSYVTISGSLEVA